MIAGKFSNLFVLLIGLYGSVPGAQSEISVVRVVNGVESSSIESSPNMAVAVSSPMMPVAPIASVAISPPIITPVCPDGKVYATKNSYRCYSPQYKNFANGMKCPAQGDIVIVSTPGCICQPGYAYIDENTCVLETSDVCGGRGSFWDASAIEKDAPEVVEKDAPEVVEKDPPQVVVKTAPNIVEKVSIVGNEKTVSTTRTDASGTHTSISTTSGV